MLILSGMLQQSYINNEHKFNKLQFHCHVLDDLWARLYVKKNKPALEMIAWMSTIDCQS